MILEHKILQALKYFGAMNSCEIREKLRLIGMVVEKRDVDHALMLMKINRLVGNAKSITTPKRKVFIALEDS